MVIIRWLLLVPLIFIVWWGVAILTFMMCTLAFGITDYAVGLDMDTFPHILIPVIGSMCAFSVVYTGYKVAPSNKNIICWITFLVGFLVLLFMASGLFVEFFNGNFKNSIVILWFLFPALSGIFTAQKLVGWPTFLSQQIE